MQRTLENQSSSAMHSSHWARLDPALKGWDCGASWFKRFVKAAGKTHSAFDGDLTP
jgi:hypothetical protein